MDVASHRLVFLLRQDKQSGHVECILTGGYLSNKQDWYFQFDHILVSGGGKDVENSQTEPVKMGLFAVWDRRESSFGSCTAAVAITVEVVVTIVRLNVEVEAVLYKRKIWTRTTVIQRISSLPLLCCHLFSFLSPPPYSSLQPPCILLSPPVSSTCPLAHAHSFPYSVLFFFLPPYITFIFLVSFISENSCPFIQSFHFSTPPPLQSFCL